MLFGCVVEKTLHKEGKYLFFLSVQKKQILTNDNSCSKTKKRLKTMPTLNKKKKEAPKEQKQQIFFTAGSSLGF